jgi:hypothetical protein
MRRTDNLENLRVEGGTILKIFLEEKDEKERLRFLTN